MISADLSEEKFIKVICICNNDINNSKEDYNLTYNLIEKEQLLEPLLFNISPVTDIGYSIKFACPYSHGSKVNILASYIADKPVFGTILVIPDNELEIEQILKKLNSILTTVNFDSAKESLDHAIQQINRQSNKEEEHNNE